ncbi:MAG: hypothetical protein MUC96_08800, partial [Myxococcaceae bacterium]|nr:hypothetical protein [Myxococcaceae bacterium]
MDASVACNAESCPTGCCDGTTCVTGTEATACGARGQACTRCPSGESCVSGTCSGCAQSCTSGCC